MEIQRASPAQMRKALEMASVFKSAGVLFVPVPVSSDAEFDEKMLTIAAEIEKMIEKLLKDI